MFEFTREFIINDNIGHLGTNKDKKFVFDSTDSTFKVERMVNIRPKDIVSIHYTKGEDASLEKATVDFTQVQSAEIKASDVMRLIVTIREQGRVISTVNDQYPWHSKQYFFEFSASATGALARADADAVVKVADHNASLEDMDRLLDFSANGANLVIKARDPYTRIYSIEIVKVPLDAAQPVGAVYTGYQDYVKVLDFKRSFLTKAENDKSAESWPATGSVVVSFEKGFEGAGTVAQLLKNNRLLTAAHLDPYGLNKDERPIPGTIYDQYVIEQVSERRHIGSQVFGAIDHSLTTFVFFVAQALKTDFDTALNSTGVTICGSAPSHAHQVIALDKDLAGNAKADAAAAAADIQAINDVIDAVQAAHNTANPNNGPIQSLKKR